MEERMVGLEKSSQGLLMTGLKTIRNRDRGIHVVPSD
jgi:hypothetical protein